jgi:hypothetical protein
MASTLTTTQGQTYDNIPELIHTVRGLQVMLDSDVAKLYGYETRRLNEVANRNSERFPENFRFRITDEEMNSIIMMSQIATSSKRKKSANPYAYTEHGIVMLAGLLRSQTAISMSLNIVKAFVAMRKLLVETGSTEYRLANLETKIIGYDKNFDKIFDAIQQEGVPPQKLFYKNSFYDAYDYVTKLIGQATTSIIVIDNYLDNSIIEILSHKSDKVEVTIVTTNKSKLDKVAIESFEKQYGEIKIVKNMSFHDRFIIIDKTDVRKFGASFKDLGKQIFGVDKINDEIMCECFIKRVNLITSGSN